MLTNLSKANFHFEGVKGLPENYPVPPHNEDTLFYIQRNLNTNTVVYELNKNLDGSVNADYPMHVYWIKYSQGGKHMELNFFQNQMAFGYVSTKISNKLFEFRMVSYKKMKFYIVLDDEYRNPKIVTNVNGRPSELTNIYVYAEELGLFPDVKYFELFGSETNGGIFNYEKIKI